MESTIGLANWLFRLWFAVSPIALALLPIIAVPLSDVGWALLVVFGVGGVGAAVLSASEQAPGRLLLHGVRRFAPAFDSLSSDAKRQVAQASRSIKVLDSYWGSVDSYRSAIEGALRTSGRCEVRILLAQEGGRFAAIRDAAIPGAIDVNKGLQSSRHSIEGLVAALRSAGPGLADRVAVRSFDALVPGPMIIIDDEHAFVGSFLQRPAGSPGSPGVWLGPAMGGLFGRKAAEPYVETFDRLWIAASKSS